MKLCVHTLQVGQSDFLAENHFVEADNEVSVQESAMEDAQPEATTDELEVVQMLWIDSGRWVDLESVVVVCRIFEKTVERVEHLVREEEEEFTALEFSDCHPSATRRLTEKDRHNPSHLHHRT